MTDNMSITGDEQPPELNTGVPQSARVWNYWLGGKDNFPADRTPGDELMDYIGRRRSGGCGGASLFPR